MGFNRFRIGVLIRVLLLSLTVYAFMYLLLFDEKYVTSFIIALVITAQIVEILRYIETTNKKLTKFLESIKYSDFSSGFTYDDKLGKTFKELNKAFNEVMEAFRQTRADKEEHLNYLNTIVQHVGTGLISFDSEGNIGLINATAKRFLHAPQIHNLVELKPTNPELYKQLVELKPGNKALIRKSSEVDLAMHATELRLRGHSIKLVALQDIKTELQQKEIEAWQNLTRVLRHEIMTSITPIASLTGTLSEILAEDITQKNGNYEMDADSKDDLSEGLQTIENRSKGLIKFVDAYRDYTSIPRPKFTIVPIKKMFDHIEHLLGLEMESLQIDCKMSVEPEDLDITADKELIEMVLINLIKNAREAVLGRDEAKIELRARMDSDQRIIIEVKDNGPGIIQEAIEKIFIPFFTTKNEGSGIGLALSRQIMQLHKGRLSVKSEPEIYTIFTLQF